MSISRNVGDAAGSALALIQLGVSEEQAGNWRAALSLFEEAAALLRTTASGSNLAITLNNMGNVAVKLGNLDSARALFRESLEIQERHGNVEGTIISLLNLGLLNLGLLNPGDEDNASARILVSRAHEHASELGHRPLVASCLDALAVVTAARRRS